MVRHRNLNITEYHELPIKKKIGWACCLSPKKRGIETKNTKIKFYKGNETNFIIIFFGLSSRLKELNNIQSTKAHEKFGLSSLLQMFLVRSAVLMLGQKMFQSIIEHRKLNKLQSHNFLPNIKIKEVINT